MKDSVRRDMTLMIAMAGAIVPMLARITPPNAVVTAQQPEREIRRPDSLPEPVGPEMRVEAEDLDDVLSSCSMCESRGSLKSTARAPGT